MIRRPPVSTLTYTPYPYTTLCRSIERDIRDQKGNLIAAAGHRVNPLDFVAIKQDLIFVDGDDAAQVAWATSRYTDLKAKIIFVNGSPIEQRSEEHTSELQSLMRISYAVFCLKNKTKQNVQNK